MGPDMTKFVIHLNRLAMILGLNIVYEYSNEEDDEGGLPNASYLETQDAVVFAWLPDKYLEDNLKEYIEMAERKFEDSKDENIEGITEEARSFYSSI